MKAYGGVEVHVHSFATSALDCEWSATSFNRFKPCEVILVHIDEKSGRVPKPVWKLCRRLLVLPGEKKQGSSGFQPLAPVLLKSQVFWDINTVPRNFSTYFPAIHSNIPENLKSWKNFFYIPTSFSSAKNRINVLQQPKKLSSGPTLNYLFICDSLHNPSHVKSYLWIFKLIF
jgi:hypothetical protein